ncbi:cation transporter [Tepidiphilus olei]|uniref:cation transporter n=1 Tax=Tepidiphilus olei TaxID=2502184 RepID=UPI001C8FA131
MTDECQKSCGCASERKAESMTGATPTGTGRMSLFSVPKMDCPSEERMIRLALENTSGLAALEFDLGKRELRVFHDGPVEPIASKLESLGLGARLIASTESNGPHTVDGQSDSQPSSEQESRALKWLLAINAAMFVVEVTIGWIAQSTGLMADSLDMFADAAVYGLALYAVGRPTEHQLKAARLSGWLQLLLALGAMSEVLRRFVFGSEPEPPLMMGIALVALIANVTCLVLISSHRKGGAHMKASWIFSTNDVLANLGVIAAGALVAWTGSRYPDLVIGSLIALLVLNGARRILRLGA